MQIISGSIREAPNVFLHTGYVSGMNDPFSDGTINAPAYAGTWFALVIMFFISVFLITQVKNKKVMWGLIIAAILSLVLVFWMVHYVLFVDLYHPPPKMGNIP